MKLGYVILYVLDVPRSAAFYGRAFGVETRFLHESNQYAELETGATALAFVSESQAESNGVTFRKTRPDKEAPSAEIALVTDDVGEAYTRALQAGATSVAGPMSKPWGQVVAYVRDGDGYLVELCSPMG